MAGNSGQFQKTRRNRQIEIVAGKINDMSFQAYLDNIQTKTGKSPEDFFKLAEKRGFLKNKTLQPGVKASQIVDWLKKDFQLGHGHAMAIYALFKGIRK